MGEGGGGGWLGEQSDMPLCRFRTSDANATPPPLAPRRYFAPPLMDNYLVRSLGGEGVFSLPYGAIGGQAGGGAGGAAGGAGQPEPGAAGAADGAGGEGTTSSASATASSSSSPSPPPYLALAEAVLAQMDVVLVLEVRQGGRGGREEVGVRGLLPRTHIGLRLGLNTPPPTSECSHLPPLTNATALQYS